jgi:(S)-2-hydroxyglutarate dehydrogenase
MRLTIIGGGIVGLALAHRVAARYPDVRVTVFEKEAGPGQHQSGNNSGVLHCGLYYKPGSMKAKLAVTGIRKMVSFCERNGIPFELCGKIVVATDESEKGRLRALYDRGLANGLKGPQLLKREQIADHEPHASGVEALHVPQEGIVDYIAVTRAMVKCIENEGSRVLFGTKVINLHRSKTWKVITTQGEFEADFIVNCAGLHCDRVSRLAGADPSARIVPFRGEYYRLKRDSEYLVRNLIYPVPDPSFPFLGVHFTRLIRGGIEAGPNAVLALAREGYKKTQIVPRDIFEVLTYPGFWKFLKKHRSMCLHELAQSFNKDRFCRALQRLVPEITVNDLEVGGAGVRAQALSPNGELLQDFCFVRQEGALHVLNAPSPAATASLAIADEIIGNVEEVFQSAGTRVLSQSE